MNKARLNLIERLNKHNRDDIKLILDNTDLESVGYKFYMNIENRKVNKKVENLIEKGLSVLVLPEAKDVNDNTVKGYRGIYIFADNNGIKFAESVGGEFYGSVIMSRQKDREYNRSYIVDTIKDVIVNTFDIDAFSIVSFEEDYDELSIYFCQAKSNILPFPIGLMGIEPVVEEIRKRLQSLERIINKEVKTYICYNESQARRYDTVYRREDKCG